MLISQYIKIHFMKYRISLNRCCPRIVAAQSEALSESSSIRSTCTCVLILSDDGHQASARTVRVVQLVSTAESRTE